MFLGIIANTEAQLIVGEGSRRRGGTFVCLFIHPLQANCQTSWAAIEGAQTNRLPLTAPPDHRCTTFREKGSSSPIDAELRLREIRAGRP